MNNIYLFPYAGGNSSTYKSYVNDYICEGWRVIPIEIPGRGRDVAGQRARSLEECAALALTQIDTTSNEYILHGHCMGALLAFEATKLIQAAGGKLPRFLVVSGRNAPRYVNDWSRSVAGLDDLNFFRELQKVGGAPKGLNFAMARNFLSVIRNDQAMSHDYAPSKSAISVPILVLAGKDDNMTDANRLADWKDYTSKFISIEWMEGRHYFIIDQAEGVSVCVRQFSKFVDSLISLDNECAATAVSS